MRRIACAMLVFMVGAAAVWAADAPMLDLVPLAGDPPQIDGQLQDACWDDAAHTDAFAEFGTGAAPEVRTEAWVTSDGDYLYVAMRCEEEPDRGVRAEHTGRPETLRQDDRVEVFLAARPQVYYHFTLGAGNAKYEQRVAGERKDLGWDVSWPSATAVGAREWTAEMALPLYIFGAGRLPAEPLYLNLTRTRYGVGQRFLTWAAVQKTFHDPERFGRLTGLEEAETPALFAPVLTGARVSGYRTAQGQATFPLDLALSNRGGKPGTVTVVVEDRPWGADPKRTEHPLDLGSLVEHETYTVQVPVAAPAARTARAWLELDGRPIGAVASVAGTDALTPLDVWLDRNYYTSEPEAQVLCKTVFTDRALAGKSFGLEVRDAQDRVVAAQERDAVNGPAFEVSLAGLAPGRYTVRVSLREDGRDLGALVRTLEKHPPAPEGVREVKLDQVNECILVDGEPWFPVGFMMYGGISEENIQQLADAGYDAMVRWWVVGGRTLDVLPRSLEQLDAAEQAGIRVFETCTGFAPSLRYGDAQFRENYLQGVENLPAYIEEFRQHPAVIGYYGLDEPGERFFDLGKRTYEIVHRLDPYHTMYSSGNSVWPDSGYEIFDLLGMHGYWDPIVREDIPLARRVAGMHIVAARHHRPFLATPQTDRPDYTRNLTPQELRCTVYLCLIHEAKGLIYFRHPVYHPTYWAMLRSVSQEAKDLAPVLMGKTPPQRVDVNLRAQRGQPVLPPGPAAALADFQPIHDVGTTLDLPLVQVLVKDLPGGGEMILAANAWRDELDAAFRVSSLGPESTVREHFTGKTYPVEDGAFEDALEPFAVRVYVTEGSTREPGTPVQVGVHLVRTKAAEPIVLHPEREEGQNLIENPGFEAQGGWTGGEIVTEAPHSGDRCLRLDAPEDAEHARATTRVALKAGQKYRLSAWVRTDIRQGTEPPRFYFFGVAGFRLPVDQAEWTQVQVDLHEPREDGTLLVGPHAPQGEGSIWVDDVEVVPLAPPAVPNLVVNGSFEAQTLPGWPDNWGTYSRSGRNIMYADAQDAWHGQNSLLIRWEQDRAYWSWNAVCEFAFEDRRPDTPYTLSLAAKALSADAPPLEVSFSGGRGGEITHIIEPTTEWKRYVLPIVLPQEDWNQWWHGDVNIGFTAQGRGGYRIDAVQFEEGDEATPYREVDYQAPKLDDKWLQYTTW